MKFLKAKSETLQAFQKFTAWEETQTGNILKRVVSDNGGEFKSEAFETWTKEKGITHHFAPAYTPKNKGMDKRKNQILITKACCLLSHSKLPNKFWAEAFKTSSDLSNLLPPCTRQFKIPYQVWFGREPKLEKLRPFGCSAFYWIPKQLGEDKF